MANKRIKEHPEYILGSEEFEGQVDFDKIFGRCAPLHFEIGSGKGTFILNQARAFPDINFLGVEWSNKYYKFAADRIGRWEVKNAKMMRADAPCYIEEHIADEAVDWYHIYFPDPWHKKKHNKRRLICDENMEQFYRTLKPGGIMNIATDHAEYFEWMTDVFKNWWGKFDKIEFTRGAGAKDGEMVGTNFERKYIPEGRITNTIALKKK